MAAPRREYAPGSRLLSRLMTARVEMVVESLDRHHAHRAPALRVVGVERDAVTEVVQCDGQVGDRRALLLVHRPPHRAGLSRRPRHVQQQQHRQVAPAPQAVQVHRLVGHRPGQHLDAGLDRRVDVDVVALRLTVAAVQAHAEPGQRASHADRVVDRRTSPMP